MKTKKTHTLPENFWKIASSVLLVVTIFLLFFDVSFAPKFQWNEDVGIGNSQTQTIATSEKTLSLDKDLELSAEWGDLGVRMIESGIIDIDQFEALYETRGGLSDEQKALLYNDDNGNLTINSENAGYLLNLFWALGLANQSSVLDVGTIQDYDDAGRFASTGGWRLAQSGTMDHFSQHSLVKLSPKQQALVEEVAMNIYRPCCNNSTYFPDCNHGMAMLGFLQLIASQGASEEEMYQQALQVNTYWFPSNYLNIAQYFQEQGIEWKDVDPKEILSASYSSSSGYSEILSSIQPNSTGGGGGCSA